MKNHQISNENLNVCTKGNRGTVKGIIYTGYDVSMLMTPTSWKLPPKLS